jgi:DNA-directed RNA polymerase subunit N (RpoN/RPB10)
MIERHPAVWRCRSCGYDNETDVLSCVYCGEPNADEYASYDDLPEEEEEEF